MGYSINSVSIRTDNSLAGITKVAELWKDIGTGRIPLMMDTEGQVLQIVPVAIYSEYENGAAGEYTLTVSAEDVSFFKRMEVLCAEGKYMAYVCTDADKDAVQLTQEAWKQVWADSGSGKIHRAFTADYEISTPKEYSSDGQARAVLYIALEK